MAKEAIPTVEPPLVHSIFVPSTQSWQYIVADPSSNHCVIFDPVRDHVQDNAEVCMAAAESIISLVKEKQYTVDYICETASSNGSHLSASWFLRMQFADIQGEAPRLSNEGTVSALQDTWRKRHGTDDPLPTKLPPSLEDGQAFLVGNLTVTCLHLPSPDAPARRAFLVGDNLFGAHSLAVLPPSSQVYQPTGASPLSDEIYQSRCLQEWESMRRVLDLPELTLLYKDQGDRDLPGDQPFDSLKVCKERNAYAGLGAEEFAVRRSGELRVPGDRKQQHVAKFPKFKRLRAITRKSGKTE